MQPTQWNQELNWMQESSHTLGRAMMLGGMVSSSLHRSITKISKWMALTITCVDSSKMQLIYLSSSFQGALVCGYLIVPQIMKVFPPMHLM